MWDKSLHFRMRILFSTVVSEFGSTPQPYRRLLWLSWSWSRCRLPCSALLCCWQAGKLLGWSWRGKRLASFENRVNRFLLPSWKTLGRSVQTCILPGCLGWKAFGRSVLSDQQTCIHPNQGDQFWGDDTRQTNRCLLGNEWHYVIHNKKHCQDAMTYKISWELECWNFARYHFGSWSRWL